MLVFGFVSVFWDTEFVARWGINVLFGGIILVSESKGKWRWGMEGGKGIRVVFYYAGYYFRGVSWLFIVVDRFD